MRNRKPFMIPLITHLSRLRCYIFVVGLGHRYVDISRNPLNFILLDNIWSELPRRCGTVRGLISRSHRSSNSSISAKTEQFLSRRKSLSPASEILTAQPQHTYPLHAAAGRCYSASVPSTSICV